VTSCIVDSAAAIYIMVVKFRNTIWPSPPQLSLHRSAALSSNSSKVDDQILVLQRVHSVLGLNIHLTAAAATATILDGDSSANGESSL
jgi:hypothetical protein